MFGTVHYLFRRIVIVMGQTTLMCRLAWLSTGWKMLVTFHFSTVRVKPQELEILSILTIISKIYPLLYSINKQFIYTV
jgi:hypothetical protein